MFIFTLEDVLGIAIIVGACIFWSVVVIKIKIDNKKKEKKDDK